MKILQKVAASVAIVALTVTPAFAYGGGGGGGGGGTSYNSDCAPSFTSISPAKNSVVNSLGTISFEVSKVAVASTVVVKVNDEEVTSTVTEKADGTLVVSAEAAAPNGTALISLYASSATSASCKRNYIYPVVIGEGGSADTLPDTEADNEGQKPNRCEKPEVEKDGTHDAEKTYSDIAGDPNAKYIEDLTSRCIVHGTSGTQTFEPSKAFNRAAAVKTVVKAFGYAYLEKVTSDPFGDVSADQWYAPYISAAKNAGIVTGKSNFHPARAMNIAEGLAIVARASGSDTSSYAGSQWYDQYIAWGTDKGLIDAGTKPGSILSRGAFARMVSQVQ